MKLQRLLITSVLAANFLAVCAQHNSTDSTFNNFTQFSRRVVNKCDLIIQYQYSSSRHQAVIMKGGKYYAIEYFSTGNKITSFYCKRFTDNEDSLKFYMKELLSVSKQDKLGQHENVSDLFIFSKEEGINRSLYNSRHTDDPTSVLIEKIRHFILVELIIPYSNRPDQPGDTCNLIREINT